MFGIRAFAGARRGIDSRIQTPQARHREVQPYARSRPCGSSNRPMMFVTERPFTSPGASKVDASPLLLSSRECDQRDCRMRLGSFVLRADGYRPPHRRNHLGAGRNHFRPLRSQPKTHRQAGSWASGQTMEFDHVGNHRFPVSRILLRPLAGDAAEPPSRQPRLGPNEDGKGQQSRGSRPASPMVRSAQGAMRTR
jgi:hypothetical protein